MRILSGLIIAAGVFLSWPTFASYSVMQGATSESETWITVMAPTREHLNFKIQTDDRAKSRPLVEYKRIGYEGSDHVVYRLHITGLDAKSFYQLEIRDEFDQLNDVRQFAAIDLNKKNGRVAVGSCMLRQFHNPYLWRNLAQPENRPDLLIILGDLVYLDRPRLLRARPPQNGLEAWQEFVKARLEEDLYYWDRLVPTLSVWDDHDAGGDNVDSTSPLIQEIREIYLTFTANVPIPGAIEAGPGLARTFHLFGKNWILLDSRSFRLDHNLDDPLFGKEQNQFLFRSLKAGANFILSGTQFYGGPIRKDSLEFNWPNYAQKWTEELSERAHKRLASLAFVSGDVHFSEVQDLETDLFGYPTIEIVASNIHSFGFPGHHLLKPRNPRRRHATGTHNIVLLEFKDSNGGFEFVTRAMGWRGNDLFRTDISIKTPTAFRCEKVLQASR